MSATETPSVQESYHSQLETIKKERHNIDERSLFEESLRSYTDSTNIDPTRLEAVIRSYNEKFETFKGVFLEQESKEQFLKLILEQDTTVVTQQRIMEVKEANLSLQRELNSRRMNADQLTEDIESKAQALDSLQQNISRKIDVIDTLNGDITAIKDQSQQIIEKYGDSLDVQDPLLQSILHKLNGRDLQTTNLHDVSTVQRQTAELTRRRLEIQRRIEELTRTKQLKLNEIKASQIQNVQLKATNELMNEEIEEIRKANDNTENLKEKESYERNNENLKIIKGSLDPLLSISNGQVTNAGSQIVFSYKSHPDVKLVITLDQIISSNNTKIDSIHCDAINEDTLRSIVHSANETSADERVNKCMQLLYIALIGSKK